MDSRLGTSSQASHICKAGTGCWEFSWQLVVPVLEVPNRAASSLPLDLSTVGPPTETPASKLATEERQAFGRVL